MNRKEKSPGTGSAPLKLQNAPLHIVNLRISHCKPTHFAALSGAHHKPKWHTLRGFGINKERAQTCMRFALSHLILLAPSPYRTENAGRGVVT